MLGAIVTTVAALGITNLLGSFDTTRFVVLAITVLAFVGAGVVAQRASRHRTNDPIPGSYDAEIIETDLYDPNASRTREPKVVRVFEGALLLLLLGYAFFDRGLAWLHIPGTPMFVGELVLMLGVWAMIAHRAPILTAIRRSPPLKILLMFMTWGFALLIFLGAGYGIDAVRDSAIWYYGFVAILTAFLVISDPRRITRWLKVFARVLPWLIGWLFIAVVLDSLVGSGPIFMPDSQVSVFSHRAGNSAVIMVICLAFIWLVDKDSKYFTPSQRIAITAASGALLLFIGLKNRGGLVAGGLGIIAILIFMHRRRSELMVTLVGIGTLLAVIAIVSQVSVALFGEREISAEQFISNITSIVSPGSGNERETTTTEWRLQLWASVLNDVNSQFPITGYGPGPDLGKIYNVTTNEAVPLRNPHNSHVGVIARLGWVGLGLWAVMWGVWVLLLLDLRTRLARRGRFKEDGVVAMLLIGAGMTLVNAFFDPTLEGPQVAMVLWFMFGLGAALQLVYHGFPELSSAEHESGEGGTTPALADTMGDSSG